MVDKNFIIDTNVFLYDPKALNNFKNDNITIPLIVLEELCDLKKQRGERGNKARIFMRYLDSLKRQNKGNFVDGIMINQTTKVSVFFEKEKSKPEGFPLPLDSKSNKVLLVAYLLKMKKEKVVFVSKDFISRLKAQAMGIETIDYENLKVAYDEIKKGVKNIKVPKRDIDLFYKDKEINLSEVGFIPNEYCLLTSEERSSAVCRFNHKKQKLEPLMLANKGIWGVSPLNAEQKCALDVLMRDDVPLVTLIGPAGTGKTLLALACGMRKVFDESQYAKILVSRPIIPLGKDLGYLPGTKEEKLYNWMQPIHDNLEFLCQSINGKEHDESALDFIMGSNKIEMEAVTYIRGRSLPKAYIIIDEAQNLTPHEIKTVISRAGKGTKVVLTGDPTQIDNSYLNKDSNGLTYVLSKFKGQALYGNVFLDKTERSELAALATKIM